MNQPCIERRALDTLIPADYNPRTITEAAMRGLRASIERFGRVHHYVDYSPFKRNKLIRRPDADVPDEPNEYGMALVRLTDKSIEVIANA